MSFIRNIKAKYLFFVLIFSFQHVLARDYQEILRSGVIYIGFDPSEVGTINYKMAYAFADYLDLRVEEVVLDWSLLFMQNGVRPENIATDTSLRFTPDAFKQIDIFCGNITPVEWRDRLFDFAYTMISAEVVVAKNDPDLHINENSSLKGLTLAMVKETSFVEHINEINEKIGGGIIIKTSKDATEAKKWLETGKVDGIVIDGPDALTFTHESKKRFRIHLPITNVSKLAWAVENGNDLKYEVQNFMDFIKSNGDLDKFFQSFYGVSYQEYEDVLESHTPVKIKNRDLDEILANKKIIVSFRERDFIYHKDGSKQFMHILAEEFAAYLGVEMEYVVVPSLNSYWQLGDSIYKDSSYVPDMFNYFDLACDIFAVLPWRTKKADLVEIYKSSYDVIAPKNVSIKGPNDLFALRGATAKNSAYYDKLTKLGVTNIYTTKVTQMVDAVRKGKADYTVILNSFMYPDLQSKFQLGNESISWCLRKDQPKLRKALENFIKESSENGLLKALDAIAKGQITTTSIEDYLKTYYTSSQKGTLPHIVVDANRGLPQEDVKCMFQDDKGFMWFGTHYGLVTYNGSKMTKYDLSNGLISNDINDIQQGKNSDVIVATDKGLSLIKANSISNIKHASSVNQIYTDNMNQTWLVCADGINRFDGERIIPLAELRTKQVGNIKSFQRYQLTDTFLLATDLGLFLYRSSGLSQIIKGELDYAFIDSRGQLWYSTSEGIYFNPYGIHKLEAVAQFNAKSGIPVSKIQAIKEGFDGSIWFQNTSNLYQITSINQRALKYSTGKDLINNIILSFLQDREQNLWIGYSGGLQKIRNNKSLRNFFPKQLDYYVSSIEVDAKNNVWITSNNGVFYYADADASHTHKPLNGSSFVRQNKEGQMYLFTEKAIYKLTPDQEMELIHNVEMSGLNGVMISSSDEVYLWTDRGHLYYMPSAENELITIKFADATAISNVIEFQGKVYVSSLDKVYIKSGNRLNLYYQHMDAIDGIGKSYDALYLSSHGVLYNLSDTAKNYRPAKDIVIKSIIPSRNRSFVWLASNKGVFYFNTTTGEQHLNITSSDGLQGNEIVDNGLYIDKTGILWILTYHGVSNYNLRSLTKVKYAPKCYLSSIIVNGEEVDSSRVEFAHNENDFVFQLSGLFFSNEKSIEYAYYLRGDRNNSNFIRYTKESKLYYDNLEPGNYELVFRAKGEDDIWSESKSYRFSIKKAFWNTWGFRITAFLLIFGLVMLVYRWRLSRIKKQKEQLEILVQERTNDLVEANNLVTAKNEEITASIHYAERIQQSLLPKEKIFKKHFSDYFVIFMPRDIVSGDFFWAYERGDRAYISAVDCTGHGVPGAFMSMLGMSFLKEIVTRYRNAQPGQMLNDLRSEIITALQQEGRLDEAKDGMDMSLISVHAQTHMMEFAGANNGVYVIRNSSDELQVNPPDKLRKRSDKLFEIQPSKMPIAIYEKMDDYDNVEVQLQKGDTVYLFSDGFPDQFGGPKNKKLMYSRLRQLLEEIQPLSMEEQKKQLLELFNEWKGDENQIDDVTMIGVRI